MRDILSETEPDTEIMCLSELKCDISDTITADDFLTEHMLTASTRDMYITDSCERIRMATRNQESGTATVMKPDIFKTSKTADVQNERLTLQKIENESVNLLIGAVYMPTDGDQQKYQQMCRTLITEVTKYRGTSEVVLIGDFNIQENHRQIRKDMFNSMVNTLGLKVHQPKTYTNLSRNKNHTRTVLDYILATPEVDVSEIEVYHPDRVPGNTSTHSPIFATTRAKKYNNNKNNMILTTRACHQGSS